MHLLCSLLWCGHFPSEGHVTLPWPFYRLKQLISHYSNPHTFSDVANVYDSVLTVDTAYAGQFCNVTNVTSTIAPGNVHSSRLPWQCSIAIHGSQKTQTTPKSSPLSGSLHVCLVLSHR